MANIAANVILLWPGTNASIPSGWLRETALDARYPRGTPNATDPGGTGGALTHSHTTPNHNHSAAHTHTVPNSPAASGSINRDPGATHAPDAHTHVSNSATVNPTASLANATPSTDAVNHEPSFFDVIFIKSDGTPTGVPDTAVAIWNEPAGAPTNWNLCDGGGAPARPDMRNRWLKGAAAAGNGGGTGGGTAHTHTIVSHDHGTNFSHDHPAVTSAAPFQAAVGAAGNGPQDATATSGHTHSLTIGTQATDAITGNTDSAASSDHQPPYWAQAFIQNNAGAVDWPDKIIGLWLGTLASIPANWKLCDGTNSTPDLRSLFVKGANTIGGIGGSGGSLTHGTSHTVTGHTHAVASHDHTVSAASGAGSNIHAGATACSTTAHTHPSWSNTGAASFTSGTGTPTVDNYTDTQPPYTNVAFIQWQVGATTYPIAVATVLTGLTENTKQLGKILTASQVISVSNVKQINKIGSVVGAFSVNGTRRIQETVAAAMNFVATVTRGNVFSKTAESVIILAGNGVRQINKVLSVSLEMSSGAIKQIGKVLIVTTSFVSTTAKQFYRTVSAAVSWGGNVVLTVIPGGEAAVVIINRASRNAYRVLIKRGGINGRR